jgi:hypothetical protein
MMMNMRAVIVSLIEILWLKLMQNQPLGIERSGVVAVQFLAGYPGFPGQSRMFSAVARHRAGRRRK